MNIFKSPPNTRQGSNNHDRDERGKGKKREDDRREGYEEYIN
jgi:hypothetical protein